MNRSGVAVASACRAGGIAAADVIVVHDDIDLCFGSLRVKLGGGHGGHNGLRSIVDLLGAREFVRVRVGVGRPPGAMDVAEYVLRAFSSTERSRLDSVLENSVKALEMLLHQGAQQAMNEFNNRVF
jgi:PTH1 family peptidyl-tRNA hydrolase